jgi:hypothetical protein
MPNFFNRFNIRSDFESFYKHIFVLSIQSYFNFGIFYKNFIEELVTVLHYAIFKYSKLQAGLILDNSSISLSSTIIA